MDFNNLSRCIFKIKKAAKNAPLPEDDDDL
jgi:hypothetical protein